MRTTTLIGKTADAAEIVVRRLGDAGGGRGRALTRQAMRNGRRTVAYTKGRLEGLRYAAAGRHPDETVADCSTRSTVAEWTRSEGRRSLPLCWA